MGDITFYALYINKHEHILKIKRNNPSFRHWVNSKVSWKENYFENPAQFNDCWTLCTSRKKLLEFAREIKKTWIKELKEELEKMEQMEIKG